MLKEAIQFIADLATSGQKPTKVYGDSHKDVYMLPGGDLKEVVKSPPDRDHRVATLEALVEIAKRFKADGLSPVVWYTFGDVCLVADDVGMRTSTVHLELNVSNTWEAVGRLRDQRFGHKEFVLLLRLTLADALPAADLLDRIRTLKFENGAITRASIKRGEESLGREISARIDAGKVEIPDEVILQVAPFTNAGHDETYPVRCIVDIDVEAQRFSLVPRPDELARVREMAADEIADRLDANLEGIPAYYGTP